MNDVIIQVCYRNLHAAKHALCMATETAHALHTKEYAAARILFASVTRFVISAHENNRCHSAEVPLKKYNITFNIIIVHVTD